MWFTTVEDGQQVLVIKRDGSMRVVKGPDRVWTWGCKVRAMDHYIAHPGEFLMVQYRDGRQEHLGGPVHVWFDPREHKSIHKEDALNIAANEAVVVYAEDLGDGQEVSRRIVHGPATFFPKPGEWLHTFSWHGSAPSAEGYRKVPNALVFQKLWKMPDQMYHDVTDVRTADDALITIRLMLFFELLDIEQMLAATHDPIGDFINAATADIVEFLSRHDFESFKHHTEKLNDLSTYKQLTVRADQCGYAINKVVYRGYGAPARLQAMHDEAIERRTRLRLDRDTQQQAQELEDLTLERTLRRNHTQREDARDDQEHQLALDRQRRRAEQEDEAHRREFLRAQQAADAAQRLELERASRQARLDTLGQLGDLGVDLTTYLTARPSDRIVELRAAPNSPAPHIHLDADALSRSEEP